ncbi:phosphatidate cytidylyltransferase [Treponema sp.]
MNDIKIAKLANSSPSPSLFGFVEQIHGVRTELIRKSIHFLIALTPTLASYNRGWTVAALASGTLVYAFAESLRMSGVRVPFVSAITAAAARERDRDRFVLGPVTLGLGAMLALLMYPEPAAAVAIYTLAFGDGIASLVGRFFGRIRPSFLFGKSLEGSASCFLVVLFVTNGLVGDIRLALFVALTATLVEALPLEDYDNIALPLSVGLVMTLLS